MAKSQNSQPTGEDASSANNYSAEMDDTGVLVLGRGISFQGTIVGATKIVIEGTFESKRLETSVLVLGRTGVFRGEAVVNEAEIDGGFEGKLKVDERLTVKPSGNLSGSAQYGSLSVEAGGVINGDLTVSRE